MKTPRRGYALMELLIVITALMIMLGLGVGLIHALLKLDRAGRAHLTEVTTRGRLARRFREDVRAASRVEATRDQSGRAVTLHLEHPDGPPVAYRAEPRRVVREQPGEDKESQTRREVYRLRGPGSPRFDVGDDGFIGLLLPDASSFAPADDRREFRIDARIGKDPRPAQPAEANP
jgi:hypothetical protein